MEYTKISKKVLSTALIESQKFGHTYVGTEHILLGLLIEKNNVANTMLVVNGVDEFTVRKMIEQNIDSGSDISIMDARLLEIGKQLGLAIGTKNFKKSRRRGRGT